MSKSRWFASCLIFCAILGFATPQIRAANEPAAAAQPMVCAGLVPDDAFAAAVFYPKRVLANEALAKFDLKGGMEGELMKQVGVSPFDVEQFVVVLGPPVAGDRHRAPTVEIIGRLSKPYDGAKLAARWMMAEKLEEAEMAGHKYFHSARKRIGPNDEPCVCFLDSQTFIMASEVWLPKIFASKDAKSMLISALAANDSAADATIIFINTEGAKEFIAEAIPKKQLAGPMKPIGDLPDLLRAAKLSIRTIPEISSKLTLLAKDEASADKLVDMIKTVQQMGQVLLPQIPPPNPNLPAAEREPQEFAVGLTKKLVDGLVPQKSGAQVTVEIGNLGTLDTVVGKLVLPAVAAARAAAAGAASMNNIRQLGLALLNCETHDGHFSAHAIYSKEGKPLLSWRVYILPFMDQEALFNQFHLDEPWDSANNKPLIAKMPAVFGSPSGKPLPEGKTRYVVPFGKGTIFEGVNGIRMSQITDGTYNTILILEVGPDKAVTWTKPDDLDFDSQKPLANLGTIGERGIMAAFADCHIMILPKSIKAETFKWLILRADGNFVDQGKL